jgi:hypothetical protein
MGDELKALGADIEYVDLGNQVGAPCFLKGKFLKCWMFSFEG